MPGAFSTVPNDSHDTGSNDSASEFLDNLERSGILTESGLQEIRNHLTSVPESQDSSALAERLVEQGRLTEFQARRLLVGKVSGLVFGRYILLDRLGRGSMGRVLKARHRLMDRVVALKVVSPAYASSLHSVSRFLREMKIVGMLDHPNVVRAFDADQQDNSPYIVMEYLEGEDLEKMLRRRGMLPPDEVIEYMAQAAWGLAHAHEKGVVHRDIKPTNLFLTTAGAVKVLDLGLGAFVGVSNEAVKAARHRRGLRGRDDRLHVARADLRTACRRPDRSVQPRLHHVPAAHGKVCLPGHDQDRPAGPTAS